MSENGMFGAKGSGDTSGFGGLVNSSSNVGVTQRPFGSYFDQIADDLERAYPLFSDAIERVVVDRGELTLFITRKLAFSGPRVCNSSSNSRMICVGQFSTVLSAAGDALSNFVWAYAGWLVKSMVSRPMKTIEVSLI